MSPVPLHHLSNSIRAYAWGSTSAIPALLGTVDDGQPKAELWIGAHPDSPSLLPDGRRLDEAISIEADQLLGTRVERSFGKRLPYLLKYLSAASPLSLQVHPDAAQAAAGFADEQQRGVPLDAANRRYRDPFHKPEMVVAIEPFEVLCGLRDPSATLRLIDTLDVVHPAWPQLRALLSAADPGQALADTLRWLLGDDPRLPSLVGTVARAATGRRDRCEFATTVTLYDAYPDDPGVLVALLLNRLTLAPGEALFLSAGQLHAYLEGVAVEVMAASDNVLRAGLTSKHVDVAEVMRTTDFTPRPIPVVTPLRNGPGWIYRPDVAEFELERVDLTSDSARQWHNLSVSGPRILLVLHGEFDVRVAGSTQRPGDPRGQRLRRGTSVFVPAADGRLSVRGTGSAVVAGVPA